MADPASLTMLGSGILALIRLVEFGFRLQNVGEENMVYLRLIDRVHQDYCEVLRERTDKISLLYQDPGKLSWIDTTLLSTKRSLEGLGKLVESGRLDIAERGQVTTRHRFEWIFSSYPKFVSRNPELQACHTSLASALTYLSVMGAVSISRNRTPDPPPYDSSEEGDDLLTIKTRQIGPLRSSQTQGCGASIVSFDSATTLQAGDTSPSPSETALHLNRIISEPSGTVAKLDSQTTSKPRTLSHPQDSTGFLEIPNSPNFPGYPSIPSNSINAQIRRRPVPPQTVENAESMPPHVSIQPQHPHQYQAYSYPFTTPLHVPPPLPDDAIPYQSEAPSSPNVQELPCVPPPLSDHESLPWDAENLPASVTSALGFDRRAVHAKFQTIKQPPVQDVSHASAKPPSQELSARPFALSENIHESVSIQSRPLETYGSARLHFRPAPLLPFPGQHHPPPRRPAESLLPAPLSLTKTPRTPPLDSSTPTAQTSPAFSPLSPRQSSPAFSQHTSPRLSQHSSFELPAAPLPHSLRPGLRHESRSNQTLLTSPPPPLPLPLENQEKIWIGEESINRAARSVSAGAELHISQPSVWSATQQPPQPQPQQTQQQQQRRRWDWKAKMLEDDDDDDNDNNDEY